MTVGATMVLELDEPITSLQAGKADDPTASWTMAVRRANHDLERALTDRGRLEAIAASLAVIVRTTGATMVTGASPLGHQLAGVIASRTDVSVALWAQNGASGTILVVEGVLVSGAQMIAAARRAQAAGASVVVGAAVLAQATGLAACRALGQEVEAIEEVRFST